MSKYQITVQHPALGEVTYIFANKEMAERYITRTADNLYNAVYWEVGDEDARRLADERKKELREGLEEIED